VPLHFLDNYAHPEPQFVLAAQVAKQSATIKARQEAGEAEDAEEEKHTSTSTSSAVPRQLSPTLPKPENERATLSISAQTYF
jgi:hypothetical protein